MSTTVTNIISNASFSNHSTSSQSIDCDGNSVAQNANALITFTNWDYGQIDYNNRKFASFVNTTSETGIKFDCDGKAGYLKQTISPSSLKGVDTLHSYQLDFSGISNDSTGYVKVIFTQTPTPFSDPGIIQFALDTDIECPPGTLTPGDTPTPPITTTPRVWLDNLNLTSMINDSSHNKKINFVLASSPSSGGGGIRFEFEDAGDIEITEIKVPSHWPNNIPEKIKIGDPKPRRATQIVAKIEK